ncbi:MAG TPA: RNA 2',3'-cyclic phosphodiesterase [Tepidisphaeraceae bacterium]|jgi:2'-5' RNA ligase|nr:RNA 2',3'-cyclic phosphodiesterase [Tepidisphaeraceae bacterium]
MRLFIAIELPEHLRRHLQRMQEMLHPIFGGKSVRPSQLHLTLKFLGETADEALPRIVQQLRAVEMGPTRLTTAGIVCFPPNGPVRIVAAALNDHDLHCAKLQSDIDHAAHAAGFPLEPRRWTPHVTLIRIKDRVSTSARSAGIAAAAGMAELDFDPDEFSLIESRLDREGPTYVTVAKFAVPVD